MCELSCLESSEIDINDLQFMVPHDFNIIVIFPAQNRQMVALGIPIHLHQDLCKVRSLKVKRKAYATENYKSTVLGLVCHHIFE